MLPADVVAPTVPAFTVEAVEVVDFVGATTTPDVVLTEDVTELLDTAGTFVSARLVIATGMPMDAETIIAAVEINIFLLNLSNIPSIVNPLLYPYISRNRIFCKYVQQNR